MVIFNDLMFKKMKKNLFSNKFNYLNKIDIEFIEEKGIFIKKDKSLMEKEWNININLWEYQVNRIDSYEFDFLPIKSEVIINEMYFLAEKIVNEFKLKFPQKKIILKLQYEDDFNIAKIFFHTLLNDISSKDNIINIDTLISDENHGISSLILIE